MPGAGLIDDAWLDRIPRELRPRRPEKDRSHRYQTAAELARDVGHYLAHEPIEARRPSLANRVGKWALRHGSLVWSLGLLLLLSTVGSLASAVLISREHGRVVQAYRDKTAQLDATERAEKLAEAQREEAIRQRDLAERNLYVARMRLAQRVWEQGQLGRLQEMLDTYTQEPGRRDLRNWEWYYFLSLCHGNLLTLPEHAAAINSVAWSPDGKNLASGSEDCTIKIWDAASGQHNRTLSGHRAGVKSIAWRPDGNRLASAGSDGEARIWDPASGKEIFCLQQPGGQARSVAWSPDGLRLAVGTAADGGTPRSVTVWDANTGRLVLDLKGRGESPVAWSSDGKRLATGTARAFECKIWDASSGEEVLALSGAFPGSQQPDSGGFQALAWSPDGRRLAAGERRNTARVWDATTGRELLAMRHAGPVTAVAWSPDGQCLVTASRGQWITLWNAATGQEILNIKGHPGSMASVAWSPDGTRLASAGSDRNVRIWDAERGQGPRVIQGAAAVWLAWSPTGDRLASTDASRLGIWDPRTGKQVQSFDMPARWLTWSPDGRRLAAANASRTVLVDLTTREQLVTAGTDRAASWSPDGTRLALVHFNPPTVEVRDTATGRKIFERQGGYAEHQASGVVWSPEGSRVATVGRAVLTIWDAASAKDIVSSRLGVQSGPAAWSPDSKRLAWIGPLPQFSVSIHDASDLGSLVSLAGHTALPSAVSWCPDGTRLATAGTDGEVKIWDPDTGDELISLAGSWVAWSPDGHRLAAIGDPNGAIMIWDASAGYQLAGSPEFRAAIHYDRAINHWRNGALDAALAEFDEVIRINPNSAKAYDRRAGLYLKRGEIDKAIADYDELIRLDPKAASNYQARARLLLDKGEFDRAAADLSNAISLSPSSELDCWLILAAARLAAGQPKEYRKTCAEMLDRFRQTESAGVAYIVAYACTLAPDAVDDWSIPVALAEMAARSDPAEAYSLFALGAVLYRSGRAFEAIGYLSQAELIEQAQTDNDGRAPVQTWLYLAMAHHRLGNGVEAQRYFEKAAPLVDKEDAGVWVLPGLTSRVALKLLAGEAGTLLKIDPVHLRQTTASRADTRYMGARRHGEKGDLTQALAAYDEAIQLDAGRAEYFFNRGKAHAGMGSLDRALADFTETIRLDPSAAAARLERGCIHVEKGDVPKADVDFREALRGNFLGWQDYFTLAESQRKAKRPERLMPEDQTAARLFQQLLRLKAKTDPAWLRWVSCCLADIARRERLPGAVFVSDMSWVSSTYGPSVPFPQRDSWCLGLNGPLLIAGLPYPKCVVTEAFEDGRPAEIVLDISAQKFRTFNAHVGVSDSFAYIGAAADPSDRGSMRFQVLVDGEVKHEIEVMQYGAICPISVPVAGAKEVRLRVLHGGDGAKNHLAGWGFARFIRAGADDPLEEPPGRLRGATDTSSALFLAQVHCRLEQKDLARRWYDKAADWLGKNPAEAEKLRAFREEASELLGISQEPLTEKEKPK